MDLLIDKYGATNSLRKAYFDLARTKYACAAAEEEYLALLKEIEAIKDLKGENPSDGDIELLLAEVYNAIPGRSLESSIALVKALVTSDDKEIPFIVDMLNNSLQSKNAGFLVSAINPELLKKIKSRVADSKNGNYLNLFFGKLDLYNGAYATAIEYFHAAKNIPEATIESLYAIGQAYLLSGNAEKAIPFLFDAKTSAKDTGKEAGISIELINALIKIKNTDAAITEIEKVKSVSSDEAILAKLDIQLSQCYMEKRDFQSSLSIINGVLANPAFRQYASNDVYIQAIVLQVRIRIIMHEYQDAIKILDESLGRELRNAELVFLKAQVFLEGQFQTDEGKNLITYLNNRSLINFENKILSELETRPTDGNAYFFAAYILVLITDRNDDRIAGFTDQATRLKLTPGNTYPEKGFYLLKGEIASKNNKNEAAVNFFEAAKCYYWSGNYPEANKYFKKATDMHQELHEAYMYFADSLFLTSFKSDPPYNDEDLVNKAFNTWHASWKQMPDLIVQQQKDNWFYITIARIHEVRYRFAVSNYYDELREAVLYAERSLIHNSTDFSAWGYLGRFYRSLELEYNSRMAFEMAEQYKPGDAFIQQERMMLKINMEDYSEPLDYIEQLRQKGDGSFKSFHKSWQAYIISHDKQRLPQAISLFDEIIQEDNNDLFSHQMKMDCHWQAKHATAAKKEAAVIIDLGNRFQYLKEDFSFSWAYFICGQPENAITILENYAEKGGDTRDSSFSLLQFYLYTGKTTEAEKVFGSFITTAYNTRVLSELSKSLDALEFQFISEQPPFYASLQQFMDIKRQWQSQIAKRLAYVTKNPLTAEQELKNTITGKEVTEDALSCIIARVGLARLYRNSKNLPEAHRMYTALLKYDSRFPEAGLAIDGLENEFLQVAIDFVKDSKYFDAVNYLESFDMGDSGKGFKKSTLLAIAFFGMAEKEKSLENIKAAFTAADKKGQGRKQVWDFLTGNAYSASLTWNFGQLMNARHAIPEAAEIVTDFWTVLMNKTSVLRPVVTPVALEISNNLVPAAAYTNDWYVITSLIPKMRLNIINTFGVKLPGIKIRGNNGSLGANTYIIILDEVPLVMGTVQQDKLFIIDQITELPAIIITGEKGYNPVSGKDSDWVNTSYRSVLDENKISYWEDPFDYMMGHLEAVLVQNLDLFVDIQFCNDYLSGFIDNKEATLPDDLLEAAKTIQADLIIPFCQLLRGLVKERVPVIDKETIIRAFQQASTQSTEVNDILQFTRLALKKELPVNKQALKMIDLPGETAAKIKEALVTSAGKSFLALTPANCQEALSAIRDIAGSSQDQLNNVLLTKDARLRIHLRKLTDLEFPNLLVASQEELIEKNNA